MPDIHSERLSIWVQIKLDGIGFASDPEFDLRYTLEDAVLDSGIGNLQGAGSGGGWMDFSFGVENIEAAEVALNFLVGLMKQYNVPREIYRFEVLRQMDTICDELPDFQAGDGLSFRFSDGEYGAALVLKRGTTYDPSHPQIGKPPADNASDEILVGVLDYKEAQRPNSSLFEQQNWLIGSHESRRGQPFHIWLDCFGGIDIKQICHIELSHSTPTECQFHLSWKDLPEYAYREKYRDDNQFTVSDYFPVYEAGTGLSFSFADGEFGAALVLKTSIEGPNSGETLLGILDYKQPHQPSSNVFEKREWRKGQPFLVWAFFLPENIELQVVTQVKITENDPMSCEFSLNWEDIPEFVLREKNG